MVAVMAGLAAILLRPLWLSSLAFALSGLAMLLAWRGGGVAAVLALIYFIAGLIYSLGVTGELKNRLSFSLRPIYDNQNILFLVLSIAACASFYTGYAAEIEREGFTLPPGITNLVTRAAEGQLEGSMVGLGPSEKEAARSQLRGQVKQEVEGMLAPFEPFIAIVVSIALLGIVTTAIGLLSWIPVLLLMALFPLLSIGLGIK
jgi:hypothetical protein